MKRSPLSTLVRSITSGVFVVFFAVSLFSAIPQRAHAFLGAADIVFDPAAFAQMISDWGIQGVQTALDNQVVVKEYVFDSLAKFAVDMALQTMVQSMANWASNGFQGSPAFETDLERSFLRMGDTIANSFTYQLRTNLALQTPFSSRVAQAVQDNYYRATGPQAYANRSKYTLSEVCPDHEAFLQGDFSACGVSGWLAAWQSPGNNPLGAQYLAEDQLAQAVSQAANEHVQQLNWGQGFLSWKGDCTNYADATAFNQDPSVALHDQDDCLSYAIETPGSVVAQTVNKYAVDVGVDLAVNADEMNEVIVGFFGQLLTDTLFGGDSGGLAGAARYERPQAQPPTTAVANALSTSFESQRPQLAQYRRDWTIIRTAAVAARDNLADCRGMPDAEAGRREAENLIARADAEIERVNLSISKYAEFEQRVELSQEGGESFEAIVAEYETFRTSGVVPSITEFREASEHASGDQTSTGEESYVAKMERYAASCRINELFNTL